MDVQTTTTTVGSASVQYSDSATLRATIAPAAASGTVQFSIDGVPVGAPVTINSGVAELTVTIQSAAGSYPTQTAFTSSDAGYADSQGASTLVVTREDADAVPSFNNPTAVKVNSPGGTAGPITLRASIQEWQDGPGQISGTTDGLGNICLAVPVAVTLSPVGPGVSFTLAAGAVVSCDGSALVVEATMVNRA